MAFLHNLMVKAERYRLILDRSTGADYLHRYYLFLKDRKSFPFNITLHKIVKSDDAIMHDHPWPFFTIILWGGYWEHLPKWNADKTAFEDIRTWRGPGSFIKHKAEDFHWLELDNENPATTLFFMGPQKKEWGFLADKVNGAPIWVEMREYFNNWRTYHEAFVVRKPKKDET